MCKMTDPTKLEADCKSHADCEYILERLPALRNDDADAQEAIHKRFFERHSKRYGEDAADEGLFAFFLACRAGHLDDNPHPYRFLLVCTRNAAHRRRRADTYVVYLPITSISVGNSATVKVSDHGLSDGNRFSIHKTNSCPDIDGKYGIKSGLMRFSVIDDHTIRVNVPEPVQVAGTKGELHVRRMKPRGLGGNDNHDEGPRIDPPDYRGSHWRMLWPILEPCLAKLDEKERYVIELWMTGESDKEIADKLRVKRERVGQIRRKAIEKLRRCLCGYEGLF